MLRHRHHITSVLWSLAVMVIGSGSISASMKWEFSLHTGLWTAFPFTTLIENQCRRAIQHELEGVMDWAFPVLLLRNHTDSLAFDPSGYSFGLALTRHFSPGPWSLGFRLSCLDQDLPYSLDAQQSLELLGVHLAHIHSRLSGTAQIHSLETALTVHYRLHDTGRIQTHLLVGIQGTVLAGNLDIHGTVQLDTPFGSSFIPLNESTPFTALRDLGLDLPKLIVYPSLGMATHLSLNKTLALAIRLTLSQGLFFDAGLSMGI